MLKIKTAIFAAKNIPKTIPGQVYRKRPVGNVLSGNRPVRETDCPGNVHKPIKISFTNMEFLCSFRRTGPRIFNTSVTCTTRHKTTNNVTM